MENRIERPNTVAGLVEKRDELIRLRKKLDEEYRAVGLDIDHLEAAIRVFDPENTPEARQRYAALHRAPKGQSRRFVLQCLREAEEPITSRRLAEMWCEHRGLVAKDSTMSMLRKRVGATLTVAHNAGSVRQNGFVDGMIGWELVRV
jgi:hypothetical protein